MILTIASLTFKEALRKKILLAAIILTILFLMLYGTGLHYMVKDLQLTRQIPTQSGARGPSQAEMDFMMEQPRKMFLLLGVYFSSSIVSLLAVFSSVGAVSSEVENGMLHAVMAKPIRRRDIVLGKFTGYALMLSCYSALLLVALLGLSAFIAGTKLPPLQNTIALFVLQPLILLAVTIAGSTKFSTLANGIIAFMLYTLGVIGGMVEQIGAIVKNAMLVKIGIVSSLIMPVDSVYRMVAGVISGSPKSQMQAMAYGPFGTISEPSQAMVFYAVLYLLFFLLAAVGVFSRRDIG